MMLLFSSKIHINNSVDMYRCCSNGFKLLSMKELMVCNINIVHPGRAEVCPLPVMDSYQNANGFQQIPHAKRLN
jgi:hypothetical protein